MWKLNGKMTKDKWLILLASGAILMILSFPGTGKDDFSGNSVESAAEPLTEAAVLKSATYEEMMEARVKEVLSHVEGVGEVDVLIVLKSSEEKVLYTDTSISSSQTRETDSSGGSRDIVSEEKEEAAVLSGSSQGNGMPIVEKELKPEISGIVISAQGGGSASVKAEISSAMEALFALPPHRIKVLKRVE